VLTLCMHTRATLLCTAIQPGSSTNTVVVAMLCDCCCTAGTNRAQRRKVEKLVSGGLTKVYTSILLTIAYYQATSKHMLS
jgi:hypothetical protein